MQVQEPEATQKGMVDGLEAEAKSAAKKGFPRWSVMLFFAYFSRLEDYDAYLWQGTWW